MLTDVKLSSCRLGFPKALDGFNSAAATKTASVLMDVNQIFKVGEIT